MNASVIRRVFSGIAALVVSPAFAADADIERGRASYARQGCYECHGHVGQGGLMTGPRLAPSPLPLSAMALILRAPSGVMPPYSTRILPDEQLADIHAFLASIPAGRPAQSIPLLAPGPARVSPPQ